MAQTGPRRRWQACLALVAATASGLARLNAQTPAVVQAQNNIDTSGAAFTSFSVSITTYPGDLLVAFVRAAATTTDNFTVTDSAGQHWTPTSSGYKNESSTGPRIGMFYMGNSASVTYVTANFTTAGGVTKPGIMVMEISGTATSWVFDSAVNGGTNADVKTSSSGSLTTTNANDILIFATDTWGNESGWTAGSGYAIPINNVTTGASGSSVRQAMQYLVVSSVQTNTTTSMTYPTSNGNGNIFAAFKGANSAGGSSSPGFVQVQNNIDTSGTAFTSFSVNIATQPGDLLVAFVRAAATTTDNFAVTDSAGQHWTQTSGGYLNESSTGPRIGMFYMGNSAAVTSVTANYTTSGGVTKPGIVVMEISGAATSGVLDVSVNGGTNANVKISSSGSLTTTNANDILIFATDTWGNESGWTAGSGYAIPNNNVTTGASGSNVRQAMQYQIVSSVQTNTTTSITYPTSNGNGNIFAAFQAAGFAPPSITSLVPSFGPVGTSVTISGLNFGNSQGTSTVKFNGTTATPTGWSANSITAPVPNGAASGFVVATVNGLPSNGAYFLVTSGGGSGLTLASIAVSPAGSSAAVGSATSLAAIAIYSNGSTQDVTSIATWTSSAPSIASINGAGIATAIADGQTVVLATVGSASGSTTLTVTPGQLDAIITPTYQPVLGGSPNQKAIAIGADGFSRFLTGSQSSSGIEDEVVYIRCLDADCSTFHMRVFATGYRTDSYSLALGPDGFARIAYSNDRPLGNADSAVHFIQCSDDDCASASDTYVADGSDNLVAGIAVGSDGTSYIVYDDGFDMFQDGGCGYYCQGVGLATCTIQGCSTIQITTINIADVIGAVVTVGADGNPVVVYEDSGDSNLGVPDSVHYYTNGADVTVSSNGGGDFYTQDVAIGPDGFARIAYVNAQDKPDFLRCTDGTCSAPSRSTIAFSGQWTDAVSVSVRSDGNAVVEGASHTSGSTWIGYVDYIRCQAADCSSYSDQTVPGSWLGSDSSLSLGQDGFPRMISMDSNNRVDHIRKVPVFNVQYRSYIPADHIHGPSACVFGSDVVNLIYKGDPGPTETFRTYQFLGIVPELQKIILPDSPGPNRTGESRNYGFGSPVNRSTLSVLDEDGIADDCLFWNEAKTADTLGFSYNASFPQAHQGQVLFSGSASNPLEKLSDWGPISWNIQTLVDATHPQSPTAQVTYSHTCYPSHEVTVNGKVVYSYPAPENDPIYITECLTGVKGPIQNQTPAVQVPTQ